MIEQVLQVYSVGGLATAVLAGTRLAGERKRWWSIVPATAIVAAVIDLRIDSTHSLPSEDRSNAILNMWLFIRNVVATFVVASVGRLCFEFNLPGFLRIPYCLLTDALLPAIVAGVLLWTACAVDVNNCL